MPVLSCLRCFLLAAFLLPGLNPQAGAQGCSPNPAGATSACDAAGPASQDSGGGVATGAGNPINLVTGNKHQREVDLAPLPGELGLEIVRHYNSSASRVVWLLGRGWRLSYETDLYVIGRSIQILQADGARLIFSRDGRDSGTCISRNPAMGRVIVRATPRGDEYTWEWRNGRKLDFNAQGRLEQIRSPSGAFVTLSRGPDGELLKVVDPQHRELRLRYPDRHSGQDRGAGNTGQFRGVVAIDSPVGSFKYEQADGNLVRVAIPTHYDGATRVHAYTERGVTGSSLSRIYHYEDPDFPAHLTGITVRGEGSDGVLVNRRIASYRYDRTGRAVLSVVGELRAHGAGIGQVNLRYPRPGVTLLTNSLGQTTSFRHAIVAGEYRLLEARGPGCAACTDANVRYAYDGLGRLVGITRLDSEGRPIARIETQRDLQGRILTVSRVAFSQGRAGRARRLLRYEYRDGLVGGIADDRPALIVRPSVVPGREHSLRIRTNAAGQVLAVVESGWSPAAAGTEVRPITRETEFGYASINGRSLLATIDGPHAVISGAARRSASPIARFDWDPSGSFVTAMTVPGGFRIAAKYDDAGRVVELADVEGHKTAFAYDARNQLVATVSDGIATNYRYDAFGNRVETGFSRGTVYRALARSGFDAARRLRWQVSQLGILETRRYDKEGKLLELGHRSASFQQTERYAYDAWGRLVAISDAAGGRRRIAYDAQGRPETFTDALGRERRYRYDAEGNLGQIVAAANTGQARLTNTIVRFERDALDRIAALIAPNGAVTRTTTDDFGRTVAVASPDSGTFSRRFDAADRLVSATDGLGNRADYEYDAAGRILEQTISPAGAGGTPIVTVWRYQGSRLIGVTHPGQSEATAYDGSGRPASRTVSLKLAEGAAVNAVTRYRYDELGQVHSVSLPDGSRLVYRRNGQNQIVAQTRSRIRTPWLAWFLPAQTIVADIERDIVGVSGLRYGNGIEARYQRSREGVLARVVYRRTQALIDRRYLWDVQGNLLHSQDASTAQNYAYDAQDRLIAAASNRTGARANYSRYFYDGAGNRRLSQEGIHDQADIRSNSLKAAYADKSNRWLGANAAAAVRYDADGQPVATAKREYVWDALGRLIEARQDGRRLARYRYNHRGERIAKTSAEGQRYYLYRGGKLAAELDGRGRITRQYIYLADQPVAVIDTPDGRALSHAERSLSGQIAADIATILKAWFADDETVVYLHTNHLGAPELATDASGHPVWAATYAPFGRIVRAAGNFKPAFKLDLRLPGQYEDEETGLYYNGRRYYDPERGRYLTPDPLGLSAGINSYAYAAGNPLKYVDPEGLILFAFDGTGNSDPAQAGSTFSNVVRFRQLYQDGGKFYITGPGTKDPATGIENPWYKLGNAGDAVESFTGKTRIAAMLDYLDQYSESADDQTAFDIDIMGFSRGSAEARDFANQVAGNIKNGFYQYGDGNAQTHCQKVELRFMGLFDTVLSVHTGSYQLGIPDSFQYVAQAVALDEYRGGLVKFPLESIMGAPASDSSTRIEQGFLGSHSDIGGSFPEDDLAKVALVWMVDQATAAGVKMDEPNRTIIANPVLHDKSSNLVTGGPQSGSEDRDVRYTNGAIVKQRQANSFGMSWADTQQFIAYKPEPNGSDSISGTVDMTAYLRWLNEHDYGIDMTVQ